MATLPAELRRALGISRRRLARIEPSTFEPPESKAARSAERIVAELAVPMVVNHSHRTFAFGAAVAAHDGLTHDREVVYVASLLHDVYFWNVLLAIAIAAYEHDEEATPRPVALSGAPSPRPPSTRSICLGVTQAWTMPDRAKPRISAHHSSHTIWKAFPRPSPMAPRTPLTTLYYGT